MRILKISALAFVCAAGGLAFSQAHAAPERGGQQAWIDRMCSGDAKGDKRGAFMEKRAERVATILQLNDTQKAAYKDLQDARAKERADFRTSLCANKPDLSSFQNRLAFREKIAQRRLDALKAETPKILAFYNSLDDKQKAAFDAMRGTMMGHGGMRPGGPRGGCGGGKGAEGPDESPTEE